MRARASVALALLFAAAVADAQPAAKTWRLGVLAADRPGRVESLLESLAGMGYVQDRNLVVTRLRFESPDELAARALELVQQKPDVIVVGHGAAALALKSLTTTIPVVMASSNDAVAQGIVASLARPGGNVTGLTNMAPVVTAKRLELLKEAVPQAKRIAALACPDIGAGSKAEWLAAQSAAHRIGVQPVPVFLRRGGELAQAFEQARRQKVDAVLVLECAFYPPFREVAAMINGSRLTAMYPTTGWTAVGGLMAYGPNSEDQWRHAAVYVDRILKGAKPSELPIEQPTKFDLVINLKTAAALERHLPQSILQRANHLVESP